MAAPKQCVFGASTTIITPAKGNFNGTKAVPQKARYNSALPVFLTGIFYFTLLLCDDVLGISDKYHGKLYCFLFVLEGKDF